MKILQITAPGVCEILDVQVPSPQAGEILMRVEVVTTCPQWDLHLRHNEPMFPGHPFQYPYTPGQPGHEATGTVEAVGEGVTEYSVGERISAWRDQGHDRPGCYAQFVVLKAENAMHVPAHLPPEKTASLELAMCVGVTFLMLEEMKALRHKRVAISGLGPAGLIAVQMARSSGAREIIGFDFSSERRALALRLGAMSALDPREEASTRLPLRSEAPPFDCALDCVGAKASAEFLMDRTADVVALFGVQREDYIFAPRHFAGLRLCGYLDHSREAAEYAARLIEEGVLDLAPLVTHHLPLSAYNEGITLLEKQQAIKVAFHPWEE